MTVPPPHPSSGAYRLPPRRSRAGWIVAGVLLLCLSAFLLMCGAGTLLYGFLGYVMVHEGHDDPWVRGSIIGGVVTICLTLPTAAAGIWALWRN